MSAEAWAEQVIDVRALARQHCALAAARWLRRRVVRGDAAGEALAHAESMERLARDIAADPGYYERRPDNMSDWQWFQAKAEGL